MVYDRTCKKYGVGLSTAWSSGATLYRGLRRLDAAVGVTSWAEAFAWLSTHEPSRPIAEIQYWGHGRWGRIFVAEDVFDAAALRETHPLHRSIAAVKERLVGGGEALVWLRTCEAFGAAAGIDFASRLADGLGAKVGGHTFIIGALQSGLRTLRPGTRPTWSPSEGIREGTPEAPLRAHGSSIRWPRTISCFTGAIPDRWFEEDGAPAD
jgi:hypothetical protein